MNSSLFIYQYTDFKHLGGSKSITVLYIHQQALASQEYISNEIKAFFERHIITDYLIVLLPEYLDKMSAVWFWEEREETFKRLPGKSKGYFDNNFFVYTYNHDLKFSGYPKQICKDEESFLHDLLRNGSTQIFKKNGGLVESSNDHHFVFPSNKHCSKFIRTGNVLVYDAEVFFLALQLIPQLKGRTTIYCDTSSINVLPFAGFEILRRFQQLIVFPSIESFKSYDVFESRTIPFSRDGLVLVSSSTSGNIIDRLVQRKLADKSQILLIYFLGPSEKFQLHENNILCDLTRHETEFPDGIDEFETYPDKQNCLLCKKFSHAVVIHGDVFLTVKPKIEKVLITSTPKHVPRFLDSFIQSYRVIKSDSCENVIIRLFYKETRGDSDANYETYIDTTAIYQNDNFEKKLDRLIDKHIPANTKYLIHLPDKSSKDLAEAILKKIAPGSQPDVIELHDGIADDIVNQRGCAVIVSSCIVTGKNLLHVSRLMRPKDQLSLIYFTGVLATRNEAVKNTLINNLSKGKDKSDERPFIAVETIYCSTDKYDTVWEREKRFIEDIFSDVNEDGPLYPYLKERRLLLLNNKQTIGLTDNAFLKSHNGQKLYLRKNFAFWNFYYEETEVSQSEVFFTINSMINFLENKELSTDCTLQQTAYVRNLLSAENFQRFNDGIIQACFLRSANPEQLAYDLDNESSEQMRVLIESMVEKHNTEHGEALMEFLLAIGLGTLRLQNSDASAVLINASLSGHPLISEFASLIKDKLMEKHLLS